MNSKVHYIVAHGIAISDGAEIAREVADIIVGSDNLQELVTLKSRGNIL